MENLIQVFIRKGELILATPLKEKNLLASPIKLNAGPSYPIVAGDVTFTIGANAALEVQLFNDEDDKDADKLLAANNADMTFNTASEAYLKYSNEITAKANAAVSLQDIGFNLKSSLDLKSIFYKKHNNTDGIKDAFFVDIQHFKTIFNFDDVEKLEINDALCFKAASTLKTNLKISWPDILSKSLGSLSKYLPLLTLDIKLSSSAFVKFDFSLTDDFTYFIKKTDANNCLVSLNKTKNTSAGITTGIDLKVGFADPATLDAQINGLFDAVCQSVFGFTSTDIDDAITKSKMGTESSIQKTIINKLFSVLKLDFITDGINAIVTKWQAIEEDIAASFKSIATAHAALSFTYQYSFIEENKELISITIPTETLKNYHPNLLRFNTSALLDDIRNGEPITVNSYLNQKTIDIKKTWGFGFELFSFNLFGKDNIDLKSIVRTNINNDRFQVTLDYIRGYDWKLGKANGKWLGQMVAKMDHYSANPTLNEFDYSIQLNTTLTDPNMGGNDFREYLDSAVLWGAVKQCDVETIFNKYHNEIIGKSVLVECKLIFSELATLALVGQIAGNGWNELNKQYLAKAMAGAMKYLPDFPLRATVEDRENTYVDLWSNYLLNPDQDLPEFAALAADTIGKLPNDNNLSKFEQKDWNTFDYYFASVIKMNTDLNDSLHGLISGFSDLQSKVNSNSPYSNFIKSYTLIKGMFTQTFYLRTLGAFLLHYVNDNNLNKEVKKVFTITYGSDADEQVINFSVV